ncbi:MAG: DUF4139 domain-containing protein [Salibacteraceae bacterium]
MIKNISTTFVLLFSLVTLIAQEAIEVPSVISAVTVYPRGAQIERLAAKYLGGGRHILRFSGIASELDPSSIGVSANGDVNVLSVSSQVNNLFELKRPANIQKLQDSLDGYEFDLKFNENMLKVYQEERKMVLSNQKVGSDNGDFIIEDLEDLSDFYRARLADIMLKEMELDAKNKRLNKSIQRLRKQLAEFNSKRNRTKGEILVEVAVPANADAKFTLSYMVSNAGWMPSYNINVSDIDKPIALSYNAKVFQNTGVDWEKVKLTLTNANPSLSGSKPKIHPWRLYFIEDITRPLERGAHEMTNKKMLDAKDQALAMEDNAVYNEVSIDYPVNDAVTQFTIKTKHSVVANGKPQIINIDAFPVSATYSYYTAPKFDPAAFLVARIAGFQDYDLLPGEANLFLANTYVGMTMLDPAIIGDTLELSLGRDQSIIVKREKIKQFTEKKKIGNSIKETVGVQISIRNTKETSIDLIVEDQIPISTDKEIEVVLKEYGEAQHDQLSGGLKWFKNLPPDTKDVYDFIYEVKYPSGKKINL